MAIRISTRANYTRFLSSLRSNQVGLVRAQEQIASGRRILRPSDDPTGSARALSIERQLADVSRFRSSASSGNALLQTAATSLQDASTLLGEARGLLLQGLNGTLAEVDREGIAREVALLREQLLDIANAKDGDRFLFAGTATSREPFESVTINGRDRVVYRGNSSQQEVEIAEGSYMPINVAGGDLFGQFEPSGTTFVGSTGITNGSTADEGVGYDELTLRHDASDLGAASLAGLALVDGGANDTFLGANQLVIDATNGTVQLGDGTSVRIPEVGARSDVTVRNAAGGVLHLDLSGWNGADFNGTVTGSGSIALGDGAFVPIDFAETDLALRDDANGTTLHVDLTGVTSAGKELVTFAGTANVFDVLAGIEADLLNEDGLSRSEIFDRLSSRIDEFDRNQENLLAGLGVLGSRSKRMEFSDNRASGMELQLESLLSRTRDADFSEVALDLALAETTLQTAQAAGSRLIQNSLLNFLR